MLPLKKYMRHVKWVRCKPTWVTRSYKLCRLHHSSLQAIHRHPSLPRPLFPRASHVALISDTEHPLVNIFSPALVLSPSVTDLHITTDTWLSSDVLTGMEAPSDVARADWLGLGGRVSDIASQLSSLTVEMPDQDLEEPLWAGRIPALLDSFAHFSSRLSVMRITPLVLTTSAINAIGKLSGLKELRLSLFDFQSGELDALQPLNLVMLHHIVVCSDSVTACCKFFKALCARDLRIMELELLLSSDTDLANFFTLLQGCGTYGTLEEIKSYSSYNGFVEQPHWYDLHTRPRFRFTPSTARSLLPFKHIETLLIGYCSPLEIQDGDLQAMFASWPNLKVFELDDDSLVADYQAPHLILGGVHQALQSVPQLEKLTLAFDGMALPPSSSAPHPSLTTWNVCSSSIALPSRLAAWLSAHYPSLSRLDYFKTYADGMASTYSNGTVRAAVVDIDSFELMAVMAGQWNSVWADIIVGAEGKKQNENEGVQSVRY
jgi:hypothetical protein